MRYLLLILLLITPVFAQQQFYSDWYLREPNMTLEYNKIPWILRGITPQLQPPQQLARDVITNAKKELRFSPLTCPGEIAHCYQIREHEPSELTSGKNYTAASGYNLPERRLKLTVCLGNDEECVDDAVSCFCPQKEVPASPMIRSRSGKCDDSQHLCRYTEGSFTLCDGNLSGCQEEWGICGCGPYSTCMGGNVNTCINDRNELFLCRGTLGQCLVQYNVCYCGTEMMALQKPCSQLSHACKKDGVNITCSGSFSDCALKNDVCSCGSVI